MRLFIVAALIVFTSLPVFARKTLVRRASITVVRANSIRLRLQPSARAKLTLVERKLIAYLLAHPRKGDINAHVRIRIRSMFPGITRRQTDLLSICVLASLAEERSLRLQMNMDRRSKIIQTLSQIQKRFASSQNGLVDNLK